MLNKLLTLLRAHDKLGCVRAIDRSWRGGSLRVPLGTALEATLAWLCAAQDATPDGGVSYGYSLTTGWRSSYPETTGYIIPSFLACAEVTGNDSLRTRALRMADWEIDVQLPDGAVQSGPLGTAVAPAVFDTGQVLFGWNAAYRATRDPRYRAAAIRAGEWLVGNLDADGAWRKNLSNLTEVSPLCINVRSAWALAESGVLFGREDFIDAGRRSGVWTLSMQDDSGWFASNAFHHGEEPLLHNIVYVIEGLLGLGTLFADEAAIAGADRAAAGLARHLLETGRTFGRYATQWRPVVSWRCLTGDAQLAGALLRLWRSGRRSLPYDEIALGLLESVSATQVLPWRAGDGLSGGVGGSWPIWGAYMAYSYPNWAAKFHLDALLLHLHGVDAQDPLAVRNGG